ncbi:CRISPR-associated protein [Priestia megaterium]|nr:CRISPR-associated protein [Priestia megaterium]
MRMNKRVYGVIIIGADMANWNADFTGRPKQTLDGRYYGSDKAAKYSIRHYWNGKGEKVLYFKRLSKADKDKGMKFLMLKEAYEKVLGKPLPSKEKKEEVLSTLFEALDVKNFGCAFAVKDFNLSVAGAVQLGQGMNIFDESMVEMQDILSPFPSGEEETQTSIGKQIHLSEAHYVYPFTVNPGNYDAFEEIVGETAAYTEHAYEQFKKGAMHGATQLNTVSKYNCYNELSLFVECKEGSLLHLEPLDKMVKMEKLEDNMVRYDLKAIEERLKKVQDEIEKVDVFYNPYRVQIDVNSDVITQHNMFEHL